MEHFLQVLVLGQNTRIKINENEFQGLKQARDTINYFFNLTENYRVVVESYRAVERAKHDAELDHILYRRLDMKISLMQELCLILQL